MNVVQILYSGLGGHSSVAFSLIDADKEKKYDHVLIFYGIEDMPQAYINRCREHNIPYFFIKKSPGFDRKSQRDVIAALRQINPGVILLHSVLLILPVYGYCTRKKVQLVAVEHQSNHLKSRIEWAWSFFVMRLSQNVVYLTEQYRSQMQKKLGIFFRPGKVRVINNGIDIDLYHQQNNSNGEAKTTFKLGMLGRLTAIKDYTTLIHSFNRLLQNNSKGLQMRLLIAGDGEMKQQLEQLAENLGISDSVQFLGMIPETAAPAFLKELDIYVHASLGETMSTAVMQAMACGKPVIASDVNGLNNMIKHNVTGLLVPAQNEEKLAEAVFQLLNNPAEAAKLGRNAFNFAAENYSSKRMFDNYTSLFST